MYILSAPGKNRLAGSEHGGPPGWKPWPHGLPAAGGRRRRRGRGGLSPEPAARAMAKGWAHEPLFRFWWDLLYGPLYLVHGHIYIYIYMCIAWLCVVVQVRGLYRSRGFVGPIDVL